MSVERKNEGQCIDTNKSSKGPAFREGSGQTDLPVSKDEAFGPRPRKRPSSLETLHCGSAPCVSGTLKAARTLLAPPWCVRKHASSQHSPTGQASVNTRSKKWEVNIWNAGIMWKCGTKQLSGTGAATLQALTLRWAPSFSLCLVWHLLQVPVLENKLPSRGKGHMGVTRVLGSGRSRFECWHPTRPLQDLGKTQHPSELRFLFCQVGMISPFSPRFGCVVINDWQLLSAFYVYFQHPLN